MLNKPVLFCHSIPLSPLYKGVIVDDLTPFLSLLPSSSPSSSINQTLFLRPEDLFLYGLRYFKYLGEE